MLFKSTSLVALLALGAASFVSAQFSALPQCGATCASQSASSNGECGASDLKCLCNNNKFVDAVYECLGTGCDFADENSSIGHLGEVCDAANSAPPPGSSTTPSGSSTTPGASTTTPGTSSTTTPGASTTSTTTSSTPSTTATRSFTRSTTPAATTTIASANNGGAAQGTSTQVVVKTVGGDTAGNSTSNGGVILGNGAVDTRGMKAGLVFGAVLVGAAMGL